MVPQDMLKKEFHINQLFSKLMKNLLIQELLSAKLIHKVHLYQILITKDLAEITILLKELRI
jgi:hypothetical protein